MIIESFLGAVLPTVGRYCIVGIDKTEDKPVAQRIVQKYSTTLPAAVADSEDLLARNYNVYYCTAGMGQANNRRADNAVSKREFYIDIDCGADKPYKTDVEGSAALKKFLAETGLPVPTIVHSGNGLHAHWFFVESVSCDQWLPVASALKVLCADKGFLVDPTVMADYVRILRIPGTTNFRGGATVVQLNKTRYYNFEDLKGAIGEDAKSMLMGIKKSLNITELDPATQALLGNRRAVFQIIAEKSIAGTGCAQIKNAIEHSDKLDEPTWRAVLSQAQVCTDREYGIQLVSQDHADYDPEAAEKKASETRGPQSCEVFQGLSTGALCRGCAFIGKIKVPVQLGYEIEKAPEQEQILATSDTGIEKVYEIPKLPFPYFRGKNGGIYKKEKPTKKDAEATADDGEIDKLIYPQDFYVYKRMVDPDYGDMLWMRLHLPKDGVREFTMSQSQAMATDKLRDEISKRGMNVHDVVQLRNLQVYICKMVEQLQYYEKANIMHSRFGWTDAGTFIFGDREYRTDGVYHSPPARILEELSNHMEPKGDIFSWADMVNIYSRPGLEAQAFTVFAAFGSALMHFANEGSCLVNLYSNKSGTGKTTAMMVANSIFGHPKHLMLQQADTFLSKMNRMGVMNSLPVFIDEITNITSDQASDLMYAITTGRGRNRMSSKENIERTNNTRWSNITVTTANSSMADKLRSLKEDPQGELARLLDIRVAQSDAITKAEADKVFQVMFSNYGVAGDKYIKHILMNQLDVLAVIQRTKEKLQTLFQFTGPERFHANTITYAFAGATIAKNLGLHSIPLGPIVKFIHTAYTGMRNTIIESRSEADGAVAAFVTEHRNNVLIINKSVTRNLPTAPMMEPKGNLLIRWEPDADILYIVASAFNRWASKNQINTRECIDDIQEKYGVVMKIDKKRMGAGTPLDIGGERVYRINSAKAKLGIRIESDDTQQDSSTGD